MNLPIKISKAISKSQAMLHKHSPEIWVGAGIIAIVGGTIWACKASRNLDAILEAGEAERETIDFEHQEKIDAIYNEEKKPGDVVNLAPINREYKKDCAICTLQTAKEIAIEYAPAVLLIGGGIGMIINGHHILLKRNSALVSAYAVLEQTFTDYRGRVRDRYGEKVENDIYTGMTYEEVVDIEVDENGKKHKVKNEIPIVGDTLSPYARVFSKETSKEWCKSASYNGTLITCQQNSANDKLHARGYLFLNEVYRMLGLEETPTGAICGWILPDADEGPLANSDRYIEFTVVNGQAPDGAEDVVPMDGDIIIDFNCQGIIYDKI